MELSARLMPSFSSAYASSRDTKSGRHSQNRLMHQAWTQIRSPLSKYAHASSRDAKSGRHSQNRLRHQAGTQKPGAILKIEIRRANSNRTALYCASSAGWPSLRGVRQSQADAYNTLKWDGLPGGTLSVSPPLRERQSNDPTRRIWNVGVSGKTVTFSSLGVKQNARVEDLRG